MKKVFAVTAVAAMTMPSVLADGHKMKMPKFYGKVNKAIMYVDQESKFNRKTNTGVVDVESSESRLGAKGGYDLGAVTAKYKLEIGLNSSKTSDNLRIRQSKVDLVTKFGTFTLGQTETAVASIIKSFDVFKGTVAQASNKDYKKFVANSGSNVGYNDRGRVDLLKYATPSFNGFQYTISQDKNDGASNDPSDTTNYEATYTEHLVNYTRKMDNMDFRVNLGYIHWAEAASGDQSELVFGGHFTMNKFTARLGYSVKKQEKDNGTTNDLEDKRMILGGAYKFGMHMVRAQYAMRDSETKPMTGTTTTDEETHISLGYGYKFNKHVAMNLIYTNLGVEQNTGAGNSVTDAAYKNDANIISFGTTVKF